MCRAASTACANAIKRRRRELVDHLYPLVIRIVRSHLPRRVPEEDLAQEVFMKMFTRLEQYQGAVPSPTGFPAFAVTTCIDHLRAQKRRPEFRMADLSEGEADVIDAVMTNANDVAPDEALEARELCPQTPRPAQTPTTASSSSCSTSSRRRLRRSAP